MANLGLDVSTFPDVDPTFSPLTGQRVVGEAVARRLITPRGSLPYDPNYGYDVRGLWNAGFLPSKLYVFQNAIESECEKDERVQSANATLSFNTQTQTLNVAVQLTTAEGPFDLVLEVGAVTVELLLGGSP